jgi:hypothetical protein
LDAPQGEKNEWATAHIPDPIYAHVPREEIIRPLLETATKAIKRWEVLLGLVSNATGFQLPSYEEPPPVQELPPQYEHTGAHFLEP